MTDTRINELAGLPDDEAIPRLQALAAEALAAQDFPLRAAALVEGGRRLLAAGREEDAAHAAMRAIALFDALQGRGLDGVALFALATRALGAMEQEERATEAKERGAKLAEARLAAAAPDARALLRGEPDVVTLLGALQS